ncbi:hypothetical protein EV385_3035 [Krasilnikovia cinnamomea]|uniref:Glycosyl transferase family 1 n=1 Tax=Krasilnikovia cinnamomea TaxID=349313 RepID=A0A4V2G754_9ACTN|nr:hypothetical protein [Krasilnikovia cinnamomea]RZU51226.1 hypothetical protein EV385_3035 [Krasilnikovia cinnamomea]
MRIGYSCWGFLANGVLDTPDGGRSYRRPFLDALRQYGHQVVLLQANRDLIEAGTDLTGAYCFDDGLPELDAVVYEWRWPLPGRNTTECATPGHTCDLHRQQQLLDHYTDALALPTIIWDQDRWLPADDPLRSRPNMRVAEYALHPTPGAVTVACPVPDQLLDAADPDRLAARPRGLPLAYVGNQYGRDDAFARYFAPAAAHLAHQVAGKWHDTEAWPHVRFTGRARFDEVAALHDRSLATVLLLPERYRTVGHQTSRLFEAVTSGCLPLTPADTVCADRFTPQILHVRDSGEVLDKVRWLTRIAGTAEHADLIRACLEHLDPFRASTQAAVLLTAVTTLAGAGRPVPHWSR